MAVYHHGVATAEARLLLMKQKMFSGCIEMCKLIKLLVLIKTWLNNYLL